MIYKIISEIIAFMCLLLSIYAVYTDNHQIATYLIGLAIFNHISATSKLD